MQAKDQPAPDITRRTAMATMTTLATGFALAVRPVSAETITTDTEGLLAGEVKIPTPTGEIPAYRAAPNKGGPFPVVLVVQEIFGVHEHIKDICRRFAKLGYLAIAPELPCPSLQHRQPEGFPISIESHPTNRALLEEPDELRARDAQFLSRGSNIEPGRLKLVEGFGDEDWVVVMARCDHELPAAGP